jgi:hypothetical protein
MKYLSELHKNAISRSLKGRKKSPEHIAKISASITGVPLSNNHRRRISESLKGKPRPRKTSFEDRFWARVEKTEGCWIWTGSLFSGSQYGQVKQNGKTKQVHRVSWELHFGPIPESMCVCHKCDNPPCVRPDHFFLGTNYDNTMDSVIKGRNYFIKNQPMHNPALLEKVVSQKRGVPRPEMRRGTDGKYISKVD